MARELKSANESYRYVELEDADHTVLRATERHKLFKALNEFLAENLGGAR